MDEELLRAFVAIPVTADARVRVAAVQNRLRGRSGVKWVEPEQFHFTLAFLGNVARGRLRLLAEELGRALAGERQFEVLLAGVGAFPSRSRPRVVWIGVTEGAPALARLAGIVTDAVARCGLPVEDRPFQAHLTIGRVKEQPAPSELVRALQAESQGAEVARLAVPEVVLMHSQLQGTGPIHTPLASFALRRDA